MSLLTLLTKRCSVRAYKSDAVEKEKLQRVLEAARLAPTACNRQAFRIVVTATEGRKNELKRIYNKDWFVQPPYLLCILKVKDEEWVRRGDEKRYGDVDAGIVFDHLVLEATEQGLGTCWVGAFDPKAAVDVLHLAPNWEPIAFTPLGYADEQPMRKIRKPLEDLVIYHT